MLIFNFPIVLSNIFLPGILTDFLGLQQSNAATTTTAPHGLAHSDRSDKSAKLLATTLQVLHLSQHSHKNAELQIHKSDLSVPLIDRSPYYFALPSTHYDLIRRIFYR